MATLFAAKRVLAVLPGLLAAGCLASSEEVDTLREVDKLVGRIELLHFEAELGKSRVEDALDSLVGLVDGEFRGDPVIAFEQLIKAIELSEEQAESLRESVDPMQNSAAIVFEQWTKDAAELRVDTLRERSTARLAETRARYEAVLAAVEEALTAYDTFNVTVRDHATYLEHDFNPEAVASLQGDVSALVKWGEDVDILLDACMSAAEVYVRAAALPGTVEVAVTEGE